MSGKTAKIDSQTYQRDADEIRRRIADGFNQWASEGVRARMTDTENESAPIMIAVPKRVRKSAE